MSDLSPAAQAVKDAAFHGVEHDTAHTLEARIAAALRAAVEQLTFNDSLAGAVINPLELLDIATELESIND